MRPRALALAGLAALVLGCGPAPAPTATTGPSSVPPSSLPAGSTVGAYFYLEDGSGVRGLVPAARSIDPATTASELPRAALEALLAGPTPAEQVAIPPLVTGVPADTPVLDFQITDGIATVDLPVAVHNAPGTGDFRPIRARLAQIVFTLTQFPAVTGVLFRTDGASQDVVDRDGNLLLRPLTRADYADELGPIFVDTPAWGATVRSPLHLSGLADVFEAQFRFRLLDADGRFLADGPLVASCGSGCRGTFGVSVPFNLEGATKAHLQVFDLSEADGSITDLVDYPLTLLP